MTVTKTCSARVPSRSYQERTLLACQYRTNPFVVQVITINLKPLIWRLILVSCVLTVWSIKRLAEVIRKIIIPRTQESWGALHSTKNSGLRFRKFHVANGTVNREIFRMVIPARVDRAVQFSFGQKFPDKYDREVLQTEIFRMEQ